MNDKPFRPMLAVPFEKASKHFRFPLLAQPKLDGIRCTIFDGVGYSRSGKPIPNKYVQDCIAKTKEFSHGFDGELMVGEWNDKDVYNRTQSAIMSHDGEPEFTFAWFDLVDDTDPDLPYIKRLTRIHLMNEKMQVAKNPWLNWIRIVSTIILKTPESVLATEQIMIQNRYEGMILRHGEAKYKQGRSTGRELALVKMKRFKDAEGTIIGFEEKMHNANPPEQNEVGYQKRSSHQANMIPMNTLGALVLSTEFRGQKVTINVGSGFDDILRQKIWDNREGFIGQVVKYKYQEHGSKDAPRIPIFLGFRHSSDT